MIGKFHQNDSGGGNPQLKKRISVLAAALVLTGVLSGCGSLNLVFNPQDLYTLPELPAKYTDLNAQINAILEDGAEYAAPTAGANIQPVQLTDLDGDGQQEAVAFFQHRFKRMGVDTALEKAGARDGDEVRILGFSFAFESPTAGAVDVYQELDL